MVINLPSEVDVVAQQKAAAAGFGNDVDSYIAHLIVSDAPELALTENQLNLSLEMIRRGEQDLAAGRTQDMREAMLALGSKRGFTIDE